MRSRDEFISSMWSKIDDLESQLVEEEITKKINKKILLRERILYLILGMVLLVSIVIVTSVGQDIILYAISIFLVLTIFILDYKSYSK